MVKNMILYDYYAASRGHFIRYRGQFSGEKMHTVYHGRDAIGVNDLFTCMSEWV